jgi:serine/threonine protein kinase
MPGTNSTQAMNPKVVADSLVGTSIDNGKYLVEKLIGEGGMGKVYQGRNTRTESPVAIKTLIPDLVKDEALVQRFEIEAKAASNLSHPNTISIYDFGREGDVLFMVMELLTGESLDSLIAREAPMPPEQLIPIIRQACKSLDEAHGAGLVHRDIKPDNIFLNRVTGQDEDHVKVLDFGVAKLQDKQFGNATLTQAGMIFGTPRYMSPEQARAFPLDGRSDIYALGVIMYEALTGSPPFLANDAVGVLIMHVNEPPAPFSTTNSAIESMPELEAVVLRCMEKDPDDRFDDVRNLLNALDGIGRLYGDEPTGTTRRQGPVETLAMKSQGPLTPAHVASDRFDALGVSSGQHANLSSYTLGATVGPTTRQHEIASGRNSLVRVGIGIAALVAISAFALLALIGSPDDPPEPTIAEADTLAELEASPAMVAGPVVTIATHEVDDAAEEATAAAIARVVAIEIVANPPEAPAFAVVSGSDDEPVPLPHTFIFTRDPNSPPVQLKFDITAEGYMATELETALAPTDGPISARMRRRSSGQSTGGRVAIPGRSDRGPSPYDR